MTRGAENWANGNPSLVLIVLRSRAKPQHHHINRNASPVSKKAHVTVAGNLGAKVTSYLGHHHQQLELQQQQLQLERRLQLRRCRSGCRYRRWWEPDNGTMIQKYINHLLRCRWFHLHPHKKKPLLIHKGIIIASSSDIPFAPWA